MLHRVPATGSGSPLSEITASLMNLTRPAGAESRAHWFPKLSMNSSIGNRGFHAQVLFLHQIAHP